MATGGAEAWGTESFKAARDMSACQYKAVYFSAADTVDVYAALKMSAGVLQNKPAAAGRAARVLFFGKTKAYLTGTVNVGDTVAPTTSGWFTRVTSGVNPVGFVTKTADSGYIGEMIMGFCHAVTATSGEAGQV